MAATTASLFLGAMTGSFQSLAEAPPGGRLKPGDKLEMEIAEDPVRGTIRMTVAETGILEFAVSSAFNVTGAVNVEGQSLAEVRAAMTQILEDRYYYKATVRLKLLDRPASVGSVLFFGEAVRGNTLQIDPGKPATLFEALLKVGYTEFANLKKVKISRIHPDTGRETVRVVNVEAIMRDRNLDVPLADGDRIEVRSRRFLF
jgi:hypothetical protein